MRLTLRNKQRLIDAFGEDYYNSLTESIKGYDYNPDNHYWNEVLKMEMLDIPSKSKPGTTYTFAIVSEKWDVIILAYYAVRESSK